MSSETPGRHWAAYDTVVHRQGSTVTTYRDDADGAAQRIRDIIRAGGEILRVHDDDGTDLPMPIVASDGRIWVWWKGSLYRDGNGAALPLSLLTP